jgi:hypothetical protein
MANCGLNIVQTSRFPFALAVRRFLTKPLLVAIVTPGECGLETLRRGTLIDLCDIEGDVGLLNRGRHWYRIHIDEIIEHTRPADTVQGLV